MKLNSLLKSLWAKFLRENILDVWNVLKKPFNFCWKAGLAIFAIVFVIQIGEELVDTCKDYLGLTHY